MIIFQDTYQNEVNLSFTFHPFSSTPKHVWILCRYKDHWLLTNHRERGLEFPGGKVEEGETPKEAAIREVKEETGAEIHLIQYIGQYKVIGKGKTVIKNIYFAIIKELIEQPTYFETMGPVLIDNIPLDGIAKDSRFSFIMKDDVLRHSINYVLNVLKGEKSSLE